MSVGHAAGRTVGHTAVIVFYISGHGFGHASRAIEVINAIEAQAPGTRIVVRTATARWLFDCTLRTPAEFHEVECDTGVVQRDGLHLDMAGTIREASRFHATLDARARVEARFLRECAATLVVGDLPPLAFAAAHQAGIPSVALGNFTWDWIYEAYGAEIAGAPDLVPAIRQAYSYASRCLRLPMWGGFEGWRCPIVDLPFVARHARRTREDVRGRLGVPHGNRLVLASFGGLGIRDLDLRPLQRLAGYTVLTTSHALGAASPVPSGVLVLDDTQVYAAGLRYEDLVRAADVVVTKPGYGIIAECLANGAAMLYTSRGHFVEYDVLVDAIPRFLRCQFIDHADLYGGRWQSHLDSVLTLPAPPDRPATNGAEVAARLVLDMIAGRSASA